MFRYINPLLLLTILSLNALNPLMVMVRPVAAASTIACNPNNALDSKYYAVSEQARSALDRKEGEKTIAALQAAIALAQQSKALNLSADVVRTWFLDTNGSDYTTSRFARLAQQLQSPPRSRAILNQFVPLTNRLSAAFSFDKTMTYSAIARHANALGQSGSSFLTQARQSERLIKEPELRAVALLDIAEAYAESSQPQPAHVVLTQTEKRLQSLSGDSVDRLRSRVAIAYAQIGNFTRAQQLAQQLAAKPYFYASAQRGIAQAYGAAGQLDVAEKLTQSIADPAIQITSIAQLAVAYQNAKNTAKATQLLRQATTLARAARETYQKESMLTEVVNAYIQVGQLQEARQVMGSLTMVHRDTLKSIVLAYHKAGNSNSVKTLLSSQFAPIQKLNDSLFQRIRLWDVLELAATIHQFDWIQAEWKQISRVDYGLLDWQIVALATRYAESGQAAQAAAWIQRLPLDNRPSDRIKALGAIALTAHRSGNTTFANQLLTQTLQTIDPLDKAERDRIHREGGDLLGLDRFKPYALGSIAVVYAQMNQPEKVRQLLQQVVAFSPKIDEPSVVGSTDHPFDRFMAAEQYLGAYQIAQGTAFPTVQEARLQATAAGLLKLNRFDLVQPVVNRLSAASNKTQLLLAIATRYGELKQPKNALAILAQAFEVARTIPGDESHYDRLGADGGTVIELDNDRGSLLEAIAVQYAQLNQTAAALKVANTLQEKATREQALQKVRCANQP